MEAGRVGRSRQRLVVETAKDRVRQATSRCGFELGCYLPLRFCASIGAVCVRAQTARTMSVTCPAKSSSRGVKHAYSKQAARKKHCFNDNGQNIFVGCKDDSISLPHHRVAKKNTHTQTRRNMPQHPAPQVLDHQPEGVKTSTGSNRGDSTTDSVPIVMLNRRRAKNVWNNPVSPPPMPKQPNSIPSRRNTQQLLMLLSVGADTTPGVAHRVAIIAVYYLPPAS